MFILDEKKQSKWARVGSIMLVLAGWIAAAAAGNWVFGLVGTIFGVPILLLSFLEWQLYVNPDDRPRDVHFEMRWRRWCIKHKVFPEVERIDEQIFDDGETRKRDLLFFSDRVSYSLDHWEAIVSVDAKKVRTQWRIYLSSGPERKGHGGVMSNRRGQQV